ncbi:hypothetical protein PQ455_05600 [Sphingomonas naphthae]|uniref:Uncharacterized protein n=1 Tax=Sphingomonas naphthae TaxID=1813468 RepID=A0ABY7TN88_9SPHN|nr:hypothetical protein [Sphingomonas naphthae]WCT74703.1 hypothetical protein PQ455_05600 [Sphingomonas naphthae]
MASTAPLSWRRSFGILCHMRKAHDPDRFHRIVGWVSAIILLLFIGLPIFAVSAIGECLPRGTPETAACDARKRMELLFLLFAIPITSAVAGWLMFRLSKFFDGPYGS